MVAICCLFSFNATAFAKDLNSDIHPDSKVPYITVKTFGSDEIFIPDTNRVTTRSGLYTYGWKIKSTEKDTRGYGVWREGPTGRGPCTLNINEGTAINREFTVTIDGNYDIGKAAIGAALGVTIGKTDTYGNSYSIDVGPGDRKTIKFRPKYQTYKVVSEYVKMNNTNGSCTVLDTQTAYVDEFVNWDYDWKYGYF